MKFTSIFFKTSASILEIYLKDTKNLRNNGRMRAKFDKWLVLIPFCVAPPYF